MPDNQLREAFAGAVHAEVYKGWWRGLTGRRIDATTVTLADAPIGKVWVRGSDDSREQTAVWGSAARVNAGVVVGPGFDGADEIKSLDWEQSTATHGDAARYLLIPPGGEEIQARSLLGLGFVPGRVEPSTLGYPYIHVRSFDFDDGFWDDGSAVGSPSAYDFSIAPYVTVPSGYSQWIPIHFDPDAGVLLASANTPVYGDVTVLDESAIDTSAIPAGMYPLGAVKVANGQTAWAATDFASKRIFLSPKGDVQNEWIVDYVSVVPAGATGIIPRGIRVTSSGSLTVLGSVYIV